MPASRWTWLVLLFLLLFVANLSIGSVSIPFPDIVSIVFSNHSNETWDNIVWDFRMTKALTCVLAGAALSLSGLQMQTLFRNALAGPDVLGITSGASLAVSITFMSAGSSLNAWGVSAAASLGALAVFTVMLIVSRNLKDNVSLLIVGLMVGAGTSSIVSVLQYLSTAEDLQTYMIWTFGSLGALSWNELLVLALILFLGFLLAITQAKSLNVWFLGESYARSLGVNTSRSRLIIIFCACILTGSVTAFCGPIAFVGLAVPHLVKMIARSHNHGILLPAVMLVGACLLLLCDILTKMPGGAQILPINAVTALFGAPVVIWVILKNRVVD
jgi:iron complex transport system permease protein